MSEEIQSAGAARPSALSIGETDIRKLEILVKESQHVAGKPIITSAVIKNPFNVIVEVLSVSLSHPWLREKARAQKMQSEDEEENKGNNFLNKTLGKTISALTTSTSLALSVPLVSMKMTNESIKKENKIIIDGGNDSTINILEPLSPDREYLINLGNSSVFNYQVQPSGIANGASEGSHLIYPYSERIASVEWNTGGWLLTVPTRLPIDVEVIYKIGNTVRSQVIVSSIDVRPPVSAFIVGSLLGSIIGSLARIFQQGQLTFDIVLASRLLVPCLLSIMAVMALSRRSGAQSFVTIEDAFGAFIIGSLIGYGGVQYFDSNFLPRMSNSIQPQAPAGK